MTKIVEDLLTLGAAIGGLARRSPAGAVVRVSVHRVGGSAEFAVEDAGPGIAADVLPHVFERFFRVDRSRSRPDGGSGLGLAISKEIAEEHGGSVRARSEVGVGSVFVSSLPLL